MPYLFQSSPQLNSIHFIYDTYKKGGYIDAFISDIDSKPKLEAVIKLLSTSGITSEFTFYKPNPYGYYNFIRIDLTDCRKAIDCLYNNGLVSVPDRANIEDEIRKVEKCLADQKKLTPTITNPQLEIIQELFTEPYIEEILDISCNLENVLFCLNIACSEYASWA